MTETAPNVSIISRFWTKTFNLSILWAHNVKATVIWGNKPSGTLATNIPIKKIIASYQVYPLSIAKIKKAAPRTIAKTAITRISRSISFFIKVSGLLIVVVDLAIVPNMVLSPVWNTTAVAVPEVKLHPILAIFLASFITSLPG